MILSLLECFKVTADTGSMRKAAEKLGLSQPTVKRRIDQLERETGKILFVRNNGCMMTVEGRNLYDFAESALLLRDTYLERDGASGKMILRISTVRGMASTLCGRWISGFSAACPDIRYKLTTGDSDEIVSRLEDASCDFGVISTLKKIPSFLDGFSVGKERVVAFTTKTGLFAGENGPVSLKNLKDQKLVIPVEDAVMEENFRTFPENVGMLCRTSNFSAAEEIIESGAAIGIYPESFLQGKLSGRICKRQLAPETSMDYYFVWNKERGIGGMLEQFMHYVRETGCSNPEK